MANDTLAPIPSSPRLSALTPDALAAANEAQDRIGELPQLSVVTEHVLHAGMYARTVRVPAGAALVGVLIQIPTLLILRGHASLFDGCEWVESKGFSVVCGSAGRKQVMVTHTDVEMTMVFPTQARTVAEAEDEFTSEVDSLVSRHGTQDVVTITGE